MSLRGWLHSAELGWECSGGKWSQVRQGPLIHKKVKQGGCLSVGLKRAMNESGGLETEYDGMARGNRVEDARRYLIDQFPA